MPPFGRPSAFNLTGGAAPLVSMPFWPWDLRLLTQRGTVERLKKEYSATADEKEKLQQELTLSFEMKYVVF